MGLVGYNHSYWASNANHGDEESMGSIESEESRKRQVGSLLLEICFPLVSTPLYYPRGLMPVNIFTLIDMTLTFLRTSSCEITKFANVEFKCLDAKNAFVQLTIQGTAF